MKEVVNMRKKYNRDSLIKYGFSENLCIFIEESSLSINENEPEFRETKFLECENFEVMMLKHKTKSKVQEKYTIIGLNRFGKISIKEKNEYVYNINFDNKTTTYLNCSLEKFFSFHEILFKVRGNKYFDDKFDYEIGCNLKSVIEKEDPYAILSMNYYWYLLIDSLITGNPM